MAERAATADPAPGPPAPTDRPDPTPVRPAPSLGREWNLGSVFLGENGALRPTGVRQASGAGGPGPQL